MYLTVELHQLYDVADPYHGNNGWVSREFITTTRSANGAIEFHKWSAVGTTAVNEIADYKEGDFLRLEFELSSKYSEKSKGYFTTNKVTRVMRDGRLDDPTRPQQGLSEATIGAKATQPPAKTVKPPAGASPAPASASSETDGGSFKDEDLPF